MKRRAPELLEDRFKRGVRDDSSCRRHVGGHDKVGDRKLYTEHFSEMGLLHW